MWPWPDRGGRPPSRSTRTERRPRSLTLIAAHVAILRELADVFAAPDALRSWWPGPVDAASCDEAVQVLDLLRRNGRGEGKWLRFAVDVAGTLRKDGDDLILAGTATQGVRVDAAGNARDVLLDASILGDAIRRHVRAPRGVSGVLRCIGQPS